MTKYIIGICNKNRTDWKYMETEVRRDALKIAHTLCGEIGGDRVHLLWLPKSAADIKRELKHGAFWAKRMGHFNLVPESKAKWAAIRKLSRVLKVARGNATPRRGKKKS